MIICSFTFLFLSYAGGTTLRNFNIADWACPTSAAPAAGGVLRRDGRRRRLPVFNTHPAQVFMGDVGALALGGAIGFVALATKTELSLPVIGGVLWPRRSATSSRSSASEAHGRRVFLMAPIHHHFEKGWPESRIVVRF